MTEGPTFVYKCEKCGRFVTRESLRSGNTFGAQLFSDGKRIAPMLPEFPSIVKCKKCKTFFWLNDKNKIGECERYEINNEWKGADKAEFLSANEYNDAINLKIYTNENEQKFLRVKLWQAFNDKIRNREDIDISDDDNEIYKQNCKILIEILEQKNIDYGRIMIDEKIMIAELNRNLGNFIECKNALEKINEEEYFWIKNILEKECIKKNQKVIELRGCSKTSAFETATIDLREKAAFRRFFQELVPKLTEFWNKLLK